MTKISACIIAKNEETCIRQCLQSVKNIVQEIILVDTGSTDATITIAEQFGAKIFHYTWNNDFAAARNYALDQAVGDWIIFLDADEYIAAESVGAIIPLLNSIHGNRKIDATSCLMQNMEGVGGEFRSINPTIRIFRKSAAIRYVGRVHEMITRRGKPVNAKRVYDRSLLIYHTGYTRNTVIDKVRRNTLILEEEIESGYVSTWAYFYLSDGYWRAGEYAKSVEVSLRAIEQLQTMQEHCEIDYKAYVYLLSSMTHLKTYSEEVVTRYCNEAAERFPHHPEIWMFQGRYFKSIGRYEKALAALLKAVQAQACYNDFTRNNDFYGARQEVYLDIAHIYDMKGEEMLSLEYYTKVLQVEKYHQAAFVRVIWFIKRQEPAELIYFLNTLYDTSQETDLRFLLEQLSRMNVKKVLLYYQQQYLKKFADNKMDALVLLATRDFEEAFPAVADLFQREKDYKLEKSAVAAFLMANKPFLATWIGPSLQSSFKRLIRAYFQPEKDIPVTLEDFSVYLDLLWEMAYLADDRQLEQLFAVGKKYFSEKMIQISILLSQVGFFQHALDVLVYHMEHTEIDSKQSKHQIYCSAGYFCYKLERFSEAARYFSLALEYGNTEKSILDFLEWSYERCPDKNMKVKFRMLQKNYK